jgi:GNAT superfamily N-acetyltransferase
MSPNISLRTFTGVAIGETIDQVAKLRIEIFAEYPFLYAGDIEYEKKYLKKFVTMQDGIIIWVYDHHTLIGVATGFPMSDDPLQIVLKDHGLDPKEYFCFGESILRKSYRNAGIGSVFMQLREAHAREHHRYKYLCFYTIDQDPHDPKRPKDYKSLHAFWNKRGFKERRDLQGSISFQQIGQDHETPQRMIFWIKQL